MRYTGPMSEGGRVIEDKSKQFNSKVVYEHPDTVTHRNVIAHKVKGEGKRLKRQLAKCEEKENQRTSERYDVTGKMMRIVYFELKLNIPLYHHQLLVELIEELGSPMGYHHFERRSAQRMGDHIS